MGGTKPWPQVPVGNKDHTSAAVLIIGAGISGMCMAIDLIKRNNCRNFIIVEKSSGVGGTWHDNKYPGCCCDVWSLLYSYSFEQNPNWTRDYPGQEEILEYLTNVASKYGLYKHIRFNTEVKSAHWDDKALQWKVDVQVSGAKDSEFHDSYTINADFLVGAVGQLNAPRWADIEGKDDFKGKLMHSARWDWSYDLRGKRIGIIGNGATAVQIVPEVLKEAKQVTIYQRTPNWVIPRMDSAVPTWKQAMYRYLPPVRWRIRALMMDFRESFYDAVTDGDSAMAKEIEHYSKEMMKRDLPGREDLWEKLTPKYSPGCKRVLITDDYFKALGQPNCKLEMEKIRRITETGIELENGESEEFDLIVFATGFRTVEFLYPIEITGANGRKLSDIWSGGACAYNGTVIEDLPNFGLFYGPNTNLGHNSIILMIEAQSRYLNTLFSAVLEAKKHGRKLALKPKPEVVKEYNDRIQKILNSTSFADPTCASWYKTAEGKITNNWSGTVIEYQELLSKVDWSDYIAEGDGANLVWHRSATHLGRVQEETVVSNWALLTSAGVLSMAAIAGGLAATGRLKRPLRKV